VTQFFSKVVITLGHDTVIPEVRKKTINEKALGETQTLHAGRSNAEPKKFAPLQTPVPGMQDCQNLISWRWSLPAPIDLVW